MSTETTVNIVSIIQPIINIIIGFILGIFSTPLSNWVFSKNNEYCAFVLPNDMQGWREINSEKRYDIIVTKSFGKTKNINCPWFKHEDTQFKRYKGKKYYSCHFGESFDSEFKETGKCPFV